MYISVVRAARRSGGLPHIHFTSSQTFCQPSAIGVCAHLVPRFMQLLKCH
jgi:hypothetical protein